MYSWIDSRSFADLPLDQRRELILGSWLGEIEVKDGVIQKWLVRRQPDGTYRVHFRITDSGGKLLHELVEVGQWGISGPVYFSILRGDIDGTGKFQARDTSDPTHYDAYKIIELTSTIFRYHHFESDTEFEVKKVASDYTLKD